MQFFPHYNHNYAGVHDSVFFIVRAMHEINFCSLQPVAFFIRPSTYRIYVTRAFHRGLASTIFLPFLRRAARPTTTTTAQRTADTVLGQDPKCGRGNRFRFRIARNREARCK